ncbi:hypothetical protein Tco_0911644 [Tanacetum coccineum]|uniref:Uncharacterized protein n=1 Tax=Tanacetum coccineum TaxID=301880 RepID=A0ABQ5CX81_9ASTR
MAEGKVRTKDAEDQDQEVPFETDQGDTFVTPEKSKGSGEAQEEQISPSTLEAAQILTIVASEGFKGSQAPLVNTAELYPDSTTSAQIIMVKVMLLRLINGEAEKGSKEKRKEPMTEEDLQAEVQAQMTSRASRTFVAFGSDEDERAIKMMNVKDADKEGRKKEELFHGKFKRKMEQRKGS